MANSLFEEYVEAYLDQTREAFDWSFEEFGKTIREAQRAATLARQLDAVLRLLEIAEQCEPPEFVGSGVFETREFTSPQGWRVSIFYDDGELDYIEHFTSPDGRVVDFWDWPEETPGRNILIAWREVGDRKWLTTFVNESRGKYVE